MATIVQSAQSASSLGSDTVTIELTDVAATNTVVVTVRQHAASHRAYVISDDATGSSYADAAGTGIAVGQVIDDINANRVARQHCLNHPGKSGTLTITVQATGPVSFVADAFELALGAFGGVEIVSAGETDDDTGDANAPAYATGLTNGAAGIAVASVVTVASAGGHTAPATWTAVGGVNAYPEYGNSAAKVFGAGISAQKGIFTQTGTARGNVGMLSFYGAESDGGGGGDPEPEPGTRVQHKTAAVSSEATKNVTFNAAITAGNTILAGWLGGTDNRSVDSVTVDGNAMSLVKSVLTDVGMRYAQLFILEDVPTTTGTVAFTFNASCTGDVVIFEITPAEVDVSDSFITTNGNADTTHHCADAASIDTADDVFILSLGVQDSIARTLTANASYTRVTLSAENMAQYREVTGAGLTNERATFTSNAGIDSAGLVASFSPVAGGGGGGGGNATFIVVF